MGADTLGFYVGGLLITFIFSRIVMKLFGGRGNNVVSAIITFFILAIAVLIITSQTMGVNAAFAVYIPCLALWLVVDIFRAVRNR